MMKFFRKYNKHLLAVFMAFLLVFWLGGTALDDMFSPKASNELIGSSKYGDVNSQDTVRAESNARLLDGLSRGATPKGQIPRRLSWTAQFGTTGGAPSERLTNIDWVLLQREAKELGVEVSPQLAKQTLLSMLGAKDSDLEFLASRQNVVVDRYYEAFAEVLTVLQMLQSFESASLPSEPVLRQMARNGLERATVELVKFPGVSFADPDKTFTDEEMAAQFEEFKDKHAIPDSLRFGYYIEPTVDLQYIRIEPAKIRDLMPGDDDSFERQAFRYWQQNQATDQRFRLPADELVAAFAERREATTNGVTPPPITPYYDNFADARTVAIEVVRDEQANREANRIATELARKLADPWFEINAAKGEYKAAPDEVKKITYYDDVIASVSAAKRYTEVIEVGLLKEITQRGLSKTEGINAARLDLTNGRSLPLGALAFSVEGLAEIPDDNDIDRSLYLSQWQTQSRPLFNDEGAIYLFRVTNTAEGHEPTGLAEVRDRVEADLRLLDGMKQAKAAAESFAAKDTGGPMKDLWGAETDLNDKITPDKGGYFEPPGFVRGRKIGEEQVRTVEGVGFVSQTFLDESFKLAAEGEDSKTAVVELADQAAWAVVKGKSFSPLYEETFNAQKAEMRRQMSQMIFQEMVQSNWLSAKKVRERTQFKYNSGA
ncbi:MAG: hypothetical protein GXP29_05290 [Planctomycetes bacterium]|nr:hypothetical protein [Planctomycetota bacterium]